MKHVIICVTFTSDKDAVSVSLGTGRFLGLPGAEAIFCIFID